MATQFKEGCGCGTWSLGINLEDSCLEVCLFEHPIYGTISLADLEKDDLERLANMFAAAALKMGLPITIPAAGKPEE